jgi:hypothetical protein
MVSYWISVFSIWFFFNLSTKPNRVEGQVNLHEITEAFLQEANLDAKSSKIFPLDSKLQVDFKQVYPNARDLAEPKTTSFDVDSVIRTSKELILLGKGKEGHITLATTPKFLARLPEINEIENCKTGSEVDSLLGERSQQLIKPIALGIIENGQKKWRSSWVRFTKEGTEFKYLAVEAQLKSEETSKDEWIERINIFSGTIMFAKESGINDIKTEKTNGNSK